MLDLLLAHGSYVAIILFLILTGAGVPVPEEVPIVAAGVLSAHGHLDPWLAVASCLLGALAGDCLMYYVGYRFGRGVLRGHHWWNRFVTPEREAKVEEMFRRHGLKFFFVARFLVGLRGPTYLTAGILRLSFRRFLLIDLVCATTVVGTFFSLSYLYGRQIISWVRRAEFLLTVIVVAVVVAVAVYLWRRHRRQTLTTDEELPGDLVELPEEPSEAAQEVERVA